MMFDPPTELHPPGPKPPAGRVLTNERGGRKAAGRPKGPAPSTRNADGSKPSCMVAAPVAAGIGLVALLVRSLR